MNKRKYDCWDEWCCPGRCGVFTPLSIGAVVAFSVLAFIFSLWAWQSSLFLSQQYVYTTSGSLTPSRYASVLASPSIPLQMTLPNNLLEYIGGLFSVDCATSIGHKVTILAGILPTTWDGNNTVATCDPGYYNAGFLFRVISQSSVRVIDPRGISFS